MTRCISSPPTTRRRAGTGLTPAWATSRPRARAKVTHWFKQQHRDQNIADGRAILEDEFKRLSLYEVDLDELARKVNYPAADDMFAAIGAGDLRPTHVAHVAQEMLEPRDKQLDLKLLGNRKGQYETDSTSRFVVWANSKPRRPSAASHCPGMLLAVTSPWVVG